MRIRWQRIVGGALCGAGMILPLHIASPSISYHDLRFWYALCVMIVLLSLGEAVKEFGK